MNLQLLSLEIFLALLALKDQLLQKAESSFREDRKGVLTAAVRTLLFGIKLQEAALAAVEATDLAGIVILSVQCVHHVVADVALEVSFELFKVQLQSALALLQVAVVLLSIEFHVNIFTQLFLILFGLELEIEFCREDVGGLKLVEVVLDLFFEL